MQVRFLPIAALFCLLFASDARAQVRLYVNANTIPSGNGVGGTSWENAATDLNTALLEAETVWLTNAGATVEIWIASGTYTPRNMDPFSPGFNTESRDLSFNLKSNLRLLGGFGGFETTATNRDIYANPTVLSGDIGIPQRAATRVRHNALNYYQIPFDEMDPGFQDNSYNVVVCDNAANVFLEGLIIASGNANYGVTNLTTLDTNLTVSYIKDMSLNADPTNVTGVAAVPLDRRVAGGAIFIRNSPSRSTNMTALTLSKCIFLNNGARGYGGAIAAQETRILGTSCLFRNNHSGEKGGAHWGQNHEAHYFFSSFQNNWARTMGGALVYETIPSTRLTANASCAAPPGFTYDSVQYAKYLNTHFSQWDMTVNMQDNADKLARLGEGVVDKLRDLYNGTSTASASSVGAADVVSGLYLALSIAVTIGDLSTAGKDDTNDADLQRWRTFSRGFTTYATPGGLVSLFSGFLISKLPDQRSREDFANLFKKTFLCAYNPSSRFGDYSYSTLRACDFVENSSGVGAGALMVGMDNLQIEACRFEGNRTWFEGGAIRSGCYNTPIILSTVFYQNYSTNGHSGGIL